MINICQSHLYSMKTIPPRLTLLVILSAVAIGLLLQGMLWRIEAVGFDWIAAILGLAAVGVLVMAGLQLHYEICHVPRENE